MAERFGAEHWPSEIRLERARKELVVAFDDGKTFIYPAEYLRVESPSAEVKGHGPNDRTTVAGRRHVGILEIEAIGNYAIRIVFDDLHDTGIYSWRYLYELGEDQARIWAAYVSALQARGLSRDP